MGPNFVCLNELTIFSRVLSNYLNPSSTDEGLNSWSRSYSGVVYCPKSDCLRIRRIEEFVVEKYSSDLITTPVHLSVGQEAVAVAVARSRQVDDMVFGTYRSHALFLACGGSLPEFFAELCGRENGCCGGKGGSMHLASPETGFVGTSAIVASSIPNAVGAGLSLRLRQRKGIVFCVIGDGAVEQGVYHESLNFASLHNVPVVVVIENNDLAVHTRVGVRQSFDRLEHAQVLGLNSYDLGEALDPDTLISKMTSVANHVRETSRPAVVEIKTFRAMEHVGVGWDFGEGYRDESEWQAWLSREWSSSNWIGRSADLKRIDSEIEIAFEWALRQPFPGPEKLLSDVV